MVKVNALSDFALRIRLFADDPDHPGLKNELAFPTCNFKVTLCTGNPESATKKFVGSYVAPDLNNGAEYDGLAKDDNGGILIYADSPNLGRGPLYAMLDFNVPDLSYADEYRRLVFTTPIGVELVSMKSEDTLDPIEVRIDLPNAFTAVTDSFLSTDGEEQADPSDNMLITITNAYNEGLACIRDALESKGVETSAADSFYSLSLKIKAL